MSSVTILEELKRKKTIKFTKLTIKIPEILKSKIDYIVKNNEINSSDYIVELLEKSEINKAYNITKKAFEEKTNKTNSTEET